MDVMLLIHQRLFQLIILAMLCMIPVGFYFVTVLSTVLKKLCNISVVFLNVFVIAVFSVKLCSTFFLLWQCVVLDIEGTTTPISFVTDVMFPYARDNVRKHLTSTFDFEETKEDIKLLRIQVSDGVAPSIIVLYDIESSIPAMTSF